MKTKVKCINRGCKLDATPPLLRCGVHAAKAEREGNAIYDKACQLFDSDRRKANPPTFSQCLEAAARALGLEQY